MYKIAVIGAGPIGLISALLLQEKVNNIQIFIYTEDESPNTTGDISAGFWTPFIAQDDPHENIIRWSKTTFNYLRELWRNGKAKEYGLSLIPVLMLSEIENDIPFWAKKAMGFEQLSQEKLEKYSAEFKKTIKQGFTHVAFTWEPTTFLPYFKEKIIVNGGKFIRKKVTEINQLSDFDIVINCAGLGAKDLTKDKELFPVRGQIRRVSAPWEFHAILVDLNYIIPNMYSIILGGTKQKDDFDTSIREDDKKKILDNCFQIEPALKMSTKIKEMAGLRPCRSKVRLELEQLKLNNKILQLVHNYGHGGSGITFSYGCALEVVELVKESIGYITNNSKLNSEKNK